MDAVAAFCEAQNKLHAFETDVSLDKHVTAYYRFCTPATQLKISEHHLREH